MRYTHGVRPDTECDTHTEWELDRVGHTYGEDTHTEWDTHAEWNKPKEIHTEWKIQSGMHMM